jgi:hypothetical protein
MEGGAPSVCEELRQPGWSSPRRRHAWSAAAVAKLGFMAGSVDLAIHLAATLLKPSWTLLSLSPSDNFVFRFAFLGSDCEAHEPEPTTQLATPQTTGTTPDPKLEPTTQETPVHPPLSLLKFGKQNHQEQGHQINSHKIIYTHKLKCNKF